MYNCVQTCLILFEIVRTKQQCSSTDCTTSMENLFKLVQTCSILFKLVQTCSNLFNLIQSFSILVNLFKLLMVIKLLNCNQFQYLLIFQTKFQQSQSYLLPQHSTLQNQQNPDRAAIFGGPKTTQNQDYSRFVFNFFFWLRNWKSGFIFMLCTSLVFFNQRI